MLLVAVGLLLGFVGLIWIMALSIVKDDGPSETSKRRRKEIIGIEDCSRDEWAA